ncbi:DUF4058 family protein [Tautonia marina]|uniref:DUF4058 family protein n=1 Tax=Tautonia marina TaxID=2653855 RepID=UPI00126087FF|nr:DUF4058 family protein [Tautonia marina]
MPIHDWTRVPAGTFHDFHHEWISTIKRALNDGLLPDGYYAMAEQIAGGMGPDVLTLERPAPRAPLPEPGQEGGLALATRPPRVRFHAGREDDLLARKAKAVVVRHSSDHRVVAMVELVSPGNKSSRYAIDAFVRKVRDALHAGIHLLIVDLFPPGPRDPHGIHQVIWEEGSPGDFPLTADEPLACVSYIGGPVGEVFLEPVAVGRPLPEMPLFLSDAIYVPVPLDPTYARAWDAVPAVWRNAISSLPPQSSI